MGLLLWVADGVVMGPVLLPRALSERCRRAMRTVQPTCAMLADRRPAPKLSRDTGFFAPYVDNGNAVAGSARAAGALLEAVEKELAAVSFVYHVETGLAGPDARLGSTRASTFPREAESHHLRWGGEAPRLN